jgi:Ca2+-dependent lipid-binding protein
MGVLTVYLDKIENLADEDHVGKSDPYVRFELEQDNVMFDKDFGEQKSTSKKDQTSPEYGETFHFNIPTLENMELTCKVMDDDIAGDDKIGKCTVKLEDMKLSSDPKPVKKKIDNNFFSKDAFIHLMLSWSE